ncbi:TonB-dependent receptor, partial [bacterium]|nr:TonB-dependent receptor [bacterium]
MKAFVRLLVAVLCSLAAAEAAGEESVFHGSVVERAESGAFQRIVGANVRWLGTGTGTVSDSNGVFHLPFIGSGALLVVSCVGYFPDTV